MISSPSTNQYKINKSNRGQDITIPKFDYKQKQDSSEGNLASKLFLCPVYETAGIWNAHIYVAVLQNPSIISIMETNGFTVENRDQVINYIHDHPGSAEYLAAICPVLNTKYPDNTKLITFYDYPEAEGIKIIIRMKEYPIDIFMQLENSVQEYNNIYPDNAKILVSTDFQPV